MANVKLAVKDWALAEPIPGLCAGCGKPTTETQPRSYIITWKQKVEFDLPYCAGCHAEHRAYDFNGLYIAIGIIVGVVGIIGAIAAHLFIKSMPVTLAILALVPIGGVIALLYVLQRRKPASHTATPLDADEKRISLVDVHDQFAGALEVLRKRKAAAGPKK